jgi:hypothetical protein
MWFSETGFHNLEYWLFCLSDNAANSGRVAHLTLAFPADETP